MVYFVIYLFFEVIISVKISSSIGGLMTFLEIIASAFLGIAILINFKESLRNNLTAVSYNCIDLNQFQNLNLFTLFGAILLIIPGFLTDIIGILMQFSVVTKMVVNRYNMRSGNCNINREDEIKLKKDSDVIDAEIINDNITHK